MGHSEAEPTNVEHFKGFHFPMLIRQTVHTVKPSTQKRDILNDFMKWSIPTILDQ